MQIPSQRRGNLPPVSAAQPLPQECPLRGWKLTLPGSHPLATPAVVDGLVFLGGGFGSYEFYALDAATGRVAWQYQTTDDGPTAAAVDDGHVAFNTESCELEVLTTAGRPAWKRWLGDPLMSMPAIGGGRVFTAFPDSRGDRRHHLACFDLRSGREFWRQPLAGEVITAPVLADGDVYLTTLDGTLFCFRQGDGQPLWREPRNATSAPLVRGGECYFSERRPARHGEAGGPTEHVARRSSAPGAETFPFPSTATASPYRDYAKRQGQSPLDRECETTDGHVGFAAHKGHSGMEQARVNLGKGHVCAVWAHQGPRPALWGGRLYSAVGDALHCADPATREAHWKRTLFELPGQAELLDEALTPPAVVNGKVFLATLAGEVMCLAASTGERLWSAKLGEPVLFQPAVAGGRVYVATQAGSLFCLETGDPADDGWLMWGAGPGHNGLPAC